MKPGYTQVLIGRTTIEVPIHIDAATSQAIADAIAGRIQEQEEEGGRIDTLAYALRTAYEYATSLDRIEQNALQDESMTREALEKLLARLKELLKGLPEARKSDQNS